ncbi:hypothetical protein [Phaeodactylibacter sp.]|uniref:hypothetical protein n=1 Tax=Phaeodactylibacter sp. TaxID=1940289 RepID=UPI0025EA0ED4|nr:hypothetical protein [Phaeodactylibacter sp.]MCI4646945.1 hypothetical protein [Phaeodactylibacter sp.]MCI5089573.1 hypothetical protein [Phaeodactylibacter sp.]
MLSKNILLLLFVLSSIPELTAQRRVLLEHYTSSWCGECPNAHLIASQIAEDHPDRVILAYHHSSVDPMANPHSTAWKNEFLIFGTPLGVINRTPRARLVQFTPVPVNGKAWSKHNSRSLITWTLTYILPPRR